MPATKRDRHPTLDLGIVQLPGYVLPLAVTSTFLYHKFFQRRRQHDQIYPPWHPSPRTTRVTSTLLSIFYFATFLLIATNTILFPTRGQPIPALAAAHIFVLTVPETWIHRTETPTRAFAAAGWFCLLLDSFNEKLIERTLAAVVLSLPSACQLSTGEDLGSSLSGMLLLTVALRDAIPTHIAELGYWIPVPLCLLFVLQCMGQKSSTVRWLAAKINQRLQLVGFVFVWLELMIVGWAVSGFASSCLSWWWMIFDGSATQPLTWPGASLFFNGNVYVGCLALLHRGHPPHVDPETKARRHLRLCVDATGWAICFWSCLWLILLAWISLVERR